MKKIVLLSFVAAAAATAAVATGNGGADAGDGAACKGGVTGFASGLNADAFATGGANCAFSGEVQFDSTTTFDNSGTFDGAFQFNSGSRQSFNIVKTGENSGFNASLNQGTGLQIFDDTASGTFSNTGTISTTNGRILGDVNANGEGGCKGGFTGSAGGFNGDVACNGNATANFTGKQDFTATETQTVTTNFDDAAFAAGSGSIQTFNAFKGDENNGVSTSLTQGTCFQISGTADGTFNSTTTTNSRGWVMGQACFGDC